MTLIDTRRFPFKHSTKSNNTTVMTQPDAEAQRLPSRLKRMSDATVRGLSRPLSLISSRASTPGAKEKKRYSSRGSARNSVSTRASQSERGPSSTNRAPSAASTRLTSMGPVSVEEGNVGELPVFGIAQRAYLASLVSLFSDGNGHDRNSSHLTTPVSTTNSALTEPSSSISSAQNLGPYEYELGSAALYKYPKARALYVGRPSVVHPPPEALLEFEMEALPTLERELQGVSAHLGNQSVRITYELRMSGYAHANADTVTLTPTVWILYRAASPAGMKASMNVLHQAVAEIFYLSKGFEIQEGGGRIELTSDRPLVTVRRDEENLINLSDGGTLSIHTEDCQEKPSVCGARCCVTIEEGATQVQSLCRIGGLLKVNDKYILGVSTAHAMLDGCSIFRDSFDEAPQPRFPQGQAVDRDRLATEAGDVTRWHDVTRDAAVDFLGISMNSRGEMAINRAKPDTATDFSLLRLKKMPGYVRNTYVPPGAPAGAPAVSITSTASASASSLDEGPVYVLCGGADVAEGQLVWGSACFIVRGRNFRLRRIQTKKPLSPGTSGAWVVRGEVLYGVIVAVYEHEPYALMMTAERLFASIMASAFSIRSVELWDGVVPEILKAYHQAHDAAKVPKKVAHLKVKPRPAQSSEKNLPEEAEEEGEGEGETNDKKKDDHELVIEEINGCSTRTGSRSNTGNVPTDIQDHLTDKKSRVVQTVIAPCSRPETADDITQESSRPPTSQLDDEDEDDLMEGDDIDGDDLVVRDVPDVDEDFAEDELDDIKSANPRYPRRPVARSRTLSKASDMTMMSGAVQTPDEPATPEEDEENHQGAKHASKTAERYSGSCVSPATESYFTPRESTSALAQERLRVGPIIYATIDQPTPHDSRSPVISNSKGVVHGGGGSGSGSGSGIGTSQVTNNTDSSSTTTNPRENRRGSLQMVLGRTFRRGSASSTSTGTPAAPTTAPTEDSTTSSSISSGSKDNRNFGIPSTGLTGRPTLFHRRRSAAAGSALTVSPAVASVGVERVSSSNTSSPDASAGIATKLRRPLRSVSTQEVPQVRRDSAGSRGVIPPPPSAAAAAATVVAAAQPGLGQRPKMAKRLSSGRPFSYGKFEANLKEKNFGIPPRGL